MLIHILPKAFLCVGCLNPCWKIICAGCADALRSNHEILPSPVSQVEGLAPLLYSYSRTQALIRTFKERGGSQLSRLLFSMSPQLKNKLLETHFFAIVPIPQDAARSFRRGHESARTTAKFFSKVLSVPLFPILKLKNNKTEQLTGLQKFEREWAESPFVIAGPREILGSRLYPLFQEKVNQGREIRLLLVDDLITSGSTLSKASYAMSELHPNLKIWGGSIGFRPRRIKSLMNLNLMN